VVGTLPLLPQFLDDPCDPSPYSPVSRLFWNEFFIDPTVTPEWEMSAAARRIAEKNDTVLAGFRRTRLINYHVAMRAKRDVLDALSKTCFAHAGRRESIERFLKLHPDTADYARFRAACERHGVPWMQWPARMRKGKLRAGDYDERAYRYHAYVQYTAEHQVQRASARLPGVDRGLYLDLPLGVNAAGYDTWREPDAFLTGLSAGAPPDPFFTKGQKWGLPPLNPHGLRRHGYRHWAACLRHHLRHAALLRIDHIMGLHRIFCVPLDMDATEGVYLKYPAKEFYAVLKIESHRAQCAVAGEDLGTVPERVRTSMRRNGVDRLYVMQFSFDGKQVATPPADSVASLNTHDMAPFAGFYRGTDIRYRVELGLMTPEEGRAEARGRAGMRTALTAFLRQEGLMRRAPKTASARAALRALLKFLARSPAAMVLVNLEDLWLEEEQQNTPGTTTERANWQRRTAKTFEEFSQDRTVLTLLREINEMRGTRTLK
jgi:4-alpha-glucanotransferase